MASKTENRRVNLYINGKEVKGSIKGITAEFKKLTAEQKDMTIGTKEYQAHAKKINRLKAVMDQHHQSINRTAGAWGSLQKAANGFNKYFMMITAGIATLTGLVMAFRKAADAANIFEERLDNLSALTGLEGKSLEWLGDKAKETSVAILEAGGHSIRIKQSASDIVDAYTKMGSQRPELLKNKELLHETTMNAIILSEAAKGKLEPSVSALATTLNQFNYAADQSNRVINTIASGSKAGAANIDYLSTAVEQSGTTMALMGMQVEQGIAIIEAVAPKFKKATKAGNSLDKVFLKMRTNNIGYVNGVFDINTALDDFKEMYGQVKVEEATLADKLEVKVSFDESAVDEIIRQAIETDQEAGPLALEVAKRLEYGLNLVRDRAGIESFIINDEAVSDMESFVNNLIKKYYRQEYPAN